VVRLRQIRQRAARPRLRLRLRLRQIQPVVLLRPVAADWRFKSTFRL
jgi:hypothetical protein